MTKELIVLVLSVLVLGPLGEWISRGGRRSRLRRRIQQELELAEKLDSRPAAQLRINRRIDALLERYEPGQKTARSQQLSEILRPVAIGLVLAVPVLWIIDATDPTTLQSVGLGAALAVVGIALSALWDRWRAPDLVAIFEAGLRDEGDAPPG